MPARSTVESTATAFAATEIPSPAPTLNVIVSFEDWSVVKDCPPVRPFPAESVIVALFAPEGIDTVTLLALVIRPCASTAI